MHLQTQAPNSHHTDPQIPLQTGRDSGENRLQDQELDVLTALPYFLRKCLPGCRKVRGRFAMGWGSGGVYVSTSMSVCTCMCVCYVGTALHPAWLPLPSHFRVCVLACVHTCICVPRSRLSRIWSSRPMCYRPGQLRALRFDLGLILSCYFLLLYPEPPRPITAFYKPLASALLREGPPCISRPVTAQSHPQ